MDLFYNLLMKWRKPVFLKEIKMAKITSQDKVLLIGCGILPSETVLIAQQTKARIIGIDNSIKACNIAQSYVQKKYLISASGRPVSMVALNNQNRFWC